MSSLAMSDIFYEFCIIGSELQKINLKDLKDDQKLPFWINIYNVILLHCYISLKAPLNTLQRITFFKNAKYQIGTHSFSLLEIEHAILRGKMARPNIMGSNLLPKYTKKDEKFDLIVDAEPLISFALSAATKSSPPIRVYSSIDVKQNIVLNAKEFMKKHFKIIHGKKKTTFVLPKIIFWYSADLFGSNDNMLMSFLVNLLPEENKEEVNTILSSGKHFKIKHEDYDWNFLYPVSNYCVPPEAEKTVESKIEVEKSVESKIEVEKPVESKIEVEKPVESKIEVEKPVESKIE